MLSSIAIELNVPRDDFSSITIELTFVTLWHGFKKAGSVLFDICAPGTRANAAFPPPERCYMYW